MRGLLFILLLAAHLFGVVIAYGSAVAAPFLGGTPLAPALRTAVSRLAVPALWTLPFSGAGLVLVAGINPSTQLWLWLSFVIYVATLVYVVVRQRPRVIRMLRGESSPGLVRGLRASSLGLLAAILAIGVMMMTKPGR